MPADMRQCLSVHTNSSVRTSPIVPGSRRGGSLSPGGLLSRVAMWREAAAGRGRRHQHAGSTPGASGLESDDGDRLETDMRAALTRGEIEVVYQPQYAAADNRIIGGEALARWRHPELGPIAPHTVFAIAAQAGLAGALSRHIMDVALAQGRAFPSQITVSLNVTAWDLAQPGFAGGVARAIERAGFPPNRLTLEITEDALVSDLAGADRSLRCLTASGTRIALDDFGAGFCNFRYLKSLPLDSLKLDRSMVCGIVEDERDLAVLRAIVALARALRLDVVAEGIETEAQRDAVFREGCASWQGFLGSQALDAESFLALVAREQAA